MHQMTALAGVRSLRKVDQVFAATNELRTRGTDNLGRMKSVMYRGRLAVGDRVHITETASTLPAY